MSATDIHMHVVPGVDDGARNLEESLTMLQLSVLQGIGTVIATPHSWGIDCCGIEYMTSQYENLKRAATERRIPVQLYLGCEMLVDAESVNRCIRKLNNGRYPTLAGSRYVLPEFDPYELQCNMELCIEKIAAAGYIPVIAHTERYQRLGAADIKRLKDLGALIQINAYSIANEKDAQILLLANDCLSEKLIDFLGSDAHRLNHRPPILSDGISEMKQLYTEEYARTILEENPKRLLQHA